MSPTELSCPACKCMLRVPGVKPGSRVRCPRCNEIFAPPASAALVAPPAEAMAEPTPAPAPSPVAASAPAQPPAAPAKQAPDAAPAPAVTDDDIFAKIAEADDPVAAVAEVRKPKPTAGEPGNPLPLDDDEPPAKARPTAAGRKAPTASKGNKNDKGKKGEKSAKSGKKRRAAEWDEDEDRVKGAINPFVLVGGLGLLAVGVLALGLFILMRSADRNAEEAAAVEKREADRREAERREAERREREAAQQKNQQPKPEWVKPDPAKPEFAKPEPVEGPEPGPGKPPVGPGAPPAFPPPVGPPVDPPFNPPPVNPPPVNPPPRLNPPGGPPQPAKPKVTFPTAVPVAIKPAPLAQDTVELKLPGVVTDACVGGGGRYWCLLLSDEKQVAVFDVNEAKVVKFLPVAGGRMRIAAGMNKLVVAYPDTGALARYDLATFQKEVTAKSPIDKFDSVMMGSASAGPLYIGTTPVDLKTFKAFGPLQPMGFGRRENMHYRVSPDGHVIGSWCSAVSPSGLNVDVVGESAVKSFRDHTSVGFINPAADGTVVTAAGVYGPTGKKLAGPAGYFLRVPAQEGRFYLTIPGGGGAQVNTGKGDIDKPTVVYAMGEARAIINLPGVALPAGNEAWTTTDFNGDKKVLFTTQGQLIAVIDKTGSKLNLHRFDLEASLDKAGIDYLFVTSRPPLAEPGKPYKYTPTVKSKKGGLSFKLDAGPEGMKVAPDGTVTWNVPANFAGGESVIITIADKTGQEIFHTFTLTAAAPRDDGGGQVVVQPDPPPAPPANPPAVGGGKPGVVQAAANPAKITPTKAADKTELKLPGTVDATCFAGGGRYVLLRIPSEKQVAVLDVCEGKIAKYIPIPEDGAFIAAGNEHLFVLAPTDNVIQRWNLTTFQKERTAANPLEGQVRGLLMGHATDGPLFVVGPNKFLDAKTLKEVAVGDGGNGRGLGGMAGHPQYPPTVRVSADGRVFAWWARGLSPSGLSSLVLGANDAKTHYEHTTVGAILPGPDGTLFTGGGLFTPELKPIGEKGRYQYWHHAPIPAAHGRMYITVAPEDDTTLNGRRGAQKVQLKMVGENKSLLDLSDLAGLDVPKNHNQTVAKGLQMYDRVFLVPDAKAVAVLHGTADRVTIHKLDVEAALDKAGIDFLFVTSRPGGAVCGQNFTYKPEVKSRKGGVKVKLDAGPEGMKVAADGTVTWAVPANFADTSVSVILTVSDASGQETFHTFTLPVASRP